MLSMSPKHKYGYDRLHWKKERLFFEKKELVSLIPHERFDKMWYLKFSWRHDKTPEFFNIFWARENSMRISLFRLNYDVWESHLPASLMRLNDLPATLVA